MISNFQETGEGVCPACGRFAGPSDECPYCSADIPCSPLRPLCRRWGLLAVLAGLALLWFWSAVQPVRLINVAEVTPRMNYAVVRIAGEIISRPYVRVDGGEGYVSFLLSDGSGTVRVSMDGRTAVEFASDAAVCCKGASLEVTGVLSIKKGREIMLFPKSPGGERAWTRVI